MGYATNKPAPVCFLAGSVHRPIIQVARREEGRPTWCLKFSPLNTWMVITRVVRLSWRALLIYEGKDDTSSFLTALRTVPVSVASAK